MYYITYLLYYIYSIHIYIYITRVSLLYYEKVILYVYIYMLYITYRVDLAAISLTKVLFWIIFMSFMNIMPFNTRPEYCFSNCLENAGPANPACNPVNPARIPGNSARQFWQKPAIFMSGMNINMFAQSPEYLLQLAHTTHSSCHTRILRMSG